MNRQQKVTLVITIIVVLFSVAGVYQIFSDNQFCFNVERELYRFLRAFIRIP